MERIDKLEKENKDIVREKEQESRLSKVKNQQANDIMQFTLQMLVRFVETSTDQVSEAFDLNEKLLQLQ